MSFSTWTSLQQDHRNDGENYFMGAVSQPKVPVDSRLGLIHWWSFIAARAQQHFPGAPSHHVHTQKHLRDSVTAREMRAVRGTFPMLYKSFNEEKGRAKAILRQKVSLE